MLNMTFMNLYVFWLRWFLYGDLPLVPDPVAITLKDDFETSGGLIGQGFISAPFIAK